MSTSDFLMLLMLTSVLTSLTVEAVKMMLGEKVSFNNNMLVGFISLVLSVIIGICYCIKYNVAFTNVTIIYILALVFMSWLCAMLGYDKVIQTLSQVKKN